MNDLVKRCYEARYRARQKTGTTDDRGRRFVMSLDTWMALVSTDALAAKAFVDRKYMGLPVRIDDELAGDKILIEVTIAET